MLSAQHFGFNTQTNCLLATGSMILPTCDGLLAVLYAIGQKLQGPEAVKEMKHLENITEVLSLLLKMREAP